jgi:hypothetical protein
VDADLTRAALDTLRPLLGDVGIIAETPLTGDDGLTVTRLVLITDAGPRTVTVTGSARPDGDAWQRARAAAGAGALAVRDEPPLLIQDDRG